jgi:hypothetical protein
VHRSYHLLNMSTSIARLSALLLLFCLAAACDGSSSPGPETPTSAAPSTSCSNEEELATDERAHKGELEGDVTGDGEADVVLIAIDEEAQIGCRALLFVISEDRTSAVSLDSEDTDMDLGLPALEGIKQVDGDGGSDVIVNLAAGASTLFASVFVFADSGLEQIQIEGSQPPVENLFAHGGGVSSLSAVDCGEDGAVVVSTAMAEGRRYRVERHTYEFEDEVLVLDSSRDETRRRSLQSIPRSFPEFSGPPFSSCPDA